MSFSLGYNLNEIGGLMDELVEVNNSTQKNIHDSFEILREKLRDNWVGPDEQNFEDKLVARLRDLQMDAKNLAEATAKTIHSMGLGWIEHQEKNVFEGEGRLSSGLTVPDVPIFSISHEASITTKSNDFTGIDLGLRYNHSKTNMEKALQEFVDFVKKSATSLYAAVDVKKAFFGTEQTDALKGYIEKVGYAVGEVQSSIKDFNDSMAILAGDNYSNALTGISDEFTTATTNMDTDLDNTYGSWRWK